MRERVIELLMEGKSSRDRSRGLNAPNLLLIIFVWRFLKLVKPRKKDVRSNSLDDLLTHSNTWDIKLYLIKIWSYSRALLLRYRLTNETLLNIWPLFLYSGCPAIIILSVHPPKRSPSRRIIVTHSTTAIKFDILHTVTEILDLLLPLLPILFLFQWN